MNIANDAPQTPGMSMPADSGGAQPAAVPAGASASYYRHHIFFCLNERPDGQRCCTAAGAEAAFAHCKQRVKELGLAGPGQVRVNRAGCLDRCAAGPVAVVYPDGVWYSYVDCADIDEIVESHLRNGQIVERLLTPPALGR